MIFALIPAAGHSRRMGRPKLALPFGESTVIESVVAAFRAAGVERVLVVLAPHVAPLAPLAERSGAHVLLLEEATADMRATVLQGVAWIEQQWRPAPDDAWFLSPADHPTLDAEVIRVLLGARAEHGGKSIFIPVWEGRRGHPALIGWWHAKGMRQHPFGEGLNSYLRSHASATVEVEGQNAGVLLDLDTPEDYERLK